MDSIETKRCSKCGLVKPATEFYSMPSKGGKLYSYCKSCKRVVRKNWDLANPEKVKATQQRNLPKQTIRARELRAIDPTPTREAQKRYRERHPNRIKNWWEKNEDKRRSYKQKRRSMQSKAGGAFTTQEWRAMCALYEQRCVCCGLEKPLTADHIIPISKGGSSYIENIQPLCGVCNSAKSYQTIDYRPDKGAGVQRQPKRQTPLRTTEDKQAATRARGERINTAKLSPAQVTEIRQRYQNERKTFTQLAPEYGVSISTIARLVKGKTWSHLE